MKEISSVFSSTTHDLDEAAEQALLFAILNKPEYEQFQTKTEEEKKKMRNQNLKNRLATLQNRSN